MTISPPPSISDHASAQDAHLRQGFGPRVRRLHACIGKAHHQAEGMAFSRALLAGAATPLQLAALIRGLKPAYRLLEEQGPVAAQALGARSIPWNALARSTALEHDQAALASLPATPASAAAQAWMDQLHTLAASAPHRFMAHVYVRYGGDLSGGQQLAQQAGQILKRASLPSLSFWEFGCPLADLKAGLHDGFEELQLREQQEQELLEEAEAAFHATQRLLAELAEIN
jgi:heme oxygenase